DGQLPEDSVHDLDRDLLKALHFLNLSQLSDMGSTLSIEGKNLNHHKVKTLRPKRIQTSGDIFEPSGELSVSFGYNFCTSDHSSSYVSPTEFELSNGVQIPNSNMKTRTGSFTCLSGAALSANATLANTNICNCVIREEILPGLDSPKSFRRRAKIFKDNEHSHRVESSSILNAMDVQMAGGDAGDDRVQAVCSEENGWLFCGVYYGFNGREAADFLAGVLYENIGFHLHLLEWRTKKLNDSSGSVNFDKEFPDESFHMGVLNCLSRALAQSESNFLHMGEDEMGERPDLVSVGSCGLVALLHGKNLYVLNLSDSRAMLAMLENQELGLMKAIQLTETHWVDNEIEYKKVLADHPDDPSHIYGGRLKGKLKLTRAFGVGYLKESNMNDALMGILRVQNLCSPPYVYTNSFTKSHQVSEKDQFQHRRVDANPCWEEEKISRRCHGRYNKQRTSTTSTSVNQHGSSFDFGELEEAIVFQGVQLRNAEARKTLYSTRPVTATLEMFPSLSMKYQPTL
ncbi:hypothetical protein GIB67_020571, partial [Kingdonia uniflora]